MSDTTHLYFAIVLGLCATAAILSALGPLLFLPLKDASRTKVAAVAWILLLGVWLVSSVHLSLNRAARPWFGAAALVIGALIIWRTRLARSVPVGGLLLLGVLRGGAAARYGASLEGWLPSTYASLSAGVASLSAVGALALWFVPTARVRAGWGAAALATVVVESVLLWRQVRPLPSFEALYALFFLPLMGIAAVAVWLGARAQAADPQGAKPQGAKPQGAKQSSMTSASSPSS